VPAEEAQVVAKIKRTCARSQGFILYGNESKVRKHVSGVTVHLIHPTTSYNTKQPQIQGLARLLDASAKILI